MGEACKTHGKARKTYNTSNLVGTREEVRLRGRLGLGCRIALGCTVGTIDT
jgi:hypothetical protein